MSGSDLIAGNCEEPAGDWRDRCGSPFEDTEAHPEERCRGGCGMSLVKSEHLPTGCSVIDKLTRPRGARRRSSQRRSPGRFRILPQEPLPVPQVSARADQQSAATAMGVPRVLVVIATSLVGGVVCAVLPTLSRRMGSVWRPNIRTWCAPPNVPVAVLLRHAESMLLPLLLTGGPGAGRVQQRDRSR